MAKKSSKRKVASKKHSCPVCGTAYPSSNMAKYCNKHNCRKSIVVSGEQKDGWIIQAYTACCIRHIVLPASRGGVDEEYIADQCGKLDALINNVFAQCKSFGLYAQQVHGHCQRLAVVLCKLWPTDKPVKMSEVFCTLACLSRDVLAEVDDSHGVLWGRVVESLGELITHVGLSPEEINQYRNAEDYNSLRRCIFGDELKPELKAYEMKGRCIIVARSKREAAARMLREFGITCKKSEVVGMDHGTKLEAASGLDAGTIDELLQRQISRGEVPPFVLTT